VPQKPTHHHDSDSKFAYFVNAAGRILEAPDTRMTVEQCGLNPAEWKRCVAEGAKEIERVSLIISRQYWEGKKERTAAQHLREKGYIEQAKARCRIRAAQNFSKNDVSLNRQIIDRYNRREDELIKFIVSEFNPSLRNTALDMELHDESTSPLRNVGAKRKGVDVG
jgi:hypothetical protein